jgi:hypothetical protein
MEVRAISSPTPMALATEISTLKRPHIVKTCRGT